MLKAIIVDDEEFARSSLFFLLQQNCPEIEIAGIARSVPEAKEILAQQTINLIFLDIAMPGQNGFALIQEAQNHQAAVVFTTAYDQYALKAIKANALDYLLKPIDIDELKIAVQKVVAYFKLREHSTEKDERINNLVDTLSTKNGIKKLTLPHGQGFKIIEVDDIVHIEADSNYSVFHLSNLEKIAVSKVLKEFEEILPSDQFFRIHKSSIINLNHLKEFTSKNGLLAVLKNGDQITVSRRRASDFFEKIKNYTNPQNDKL